MELAFKDFSILSSGIHFVYRSRMILAILVGSHLGNIAKKFESHLPTGIGEDRFIANYSRFPILSSGGHFVHWSVTFKLFW